MYALIYKGVMFLGVFSSKKTMRIVIEGLIRDQYESDGYYGDYHFQYVKFNPNEPWIIKNGKKSTRRNTRIAFTSYNAF